VVVGIGVAVGALPPPCLKPAGAVIPPHQWAGIALGVKATSAHGSIAGIDLFYHVGSAHYEWHGHVRIVLTSIPRTT